MKKAHWFLSILFPLVLLTGCAHKAQKPTPSPLTAKPKAQAAQKEAPKLNSWQASGRIAAQKGDKGNNASFVWTQQGEFYKIKLYGPFGSGSAYITGHPQSVELKESNGKTTRAKTAEELLQKVARMQLPISGLSYWLKGVASPHLPIQTQKTNAQGQLEYLEQQGWKIRYENYSQAGLALPSKLRLENGNIRLKMIVTDWQAL